jgi:hypothetical protein
MIGSKNALRLLFLAGIALLLFAGPALAAGHCKRVVLVEDAETSMSPSGEFVGFLTLAVGDTVQRVESKAMMLGTLEVNPDTGVMKAVTSHDWRSSQSFRLTTFDDATLIPTDTQGVFQLVSRLRVDSGIGRFASGEIVMHGRIDLVTGVATFPAMIPDGSGGEIPGTMGKLCSPTPRLFRGR